MNFRGAVISVGGTWEPIVKNLNEARPEFVLFVVSQDSKTEVQSNILPKLSYTPQYSCLTTLEVGDLADCYERIREGIPKWLEERNLRPEEVYVDITGATKPMSAALAMAGAERFAHFSYVAGAQRNKGGLGVVVSGTETVFRTVNPWDKLATRERERSTLLLRRGHAEQAAELLQQAAQKCSPALQQELGTLAKLVEWFARADLFRFGGLWHEYGRQRDKLNLIFSHRGQFSVFERIDATADHWRKLEEESKGKGTGVSATLRELLANAERRAHQRRYDDAAARLYRAAELFVQGKLFDAFKADLGKVRRDQIPKEHFTQWVETFGRGEEGGYVLGVRDAFMALSLSAHPEHRQVAEQYHLIANHLQKRNNSILAHGLQPCTEDALTGFWAALLPVVQIQEEEVPRWPEMEF
jgi:CRISPR-associated protein (TIGR02710 family)